MAVPQLITAEQFMEMPDVSDKQFELIAGQPVERTLFGARVALIAMQVFRVLHAYGEKRNLGEVFTSGLGYILHRDPDTVRMATGSFIAASSVPDVISDRFWVGAPDIAVEVISPEDRAEIVHARIHEFLEAGTRFVSVLWPKQHTVSVYRPDGMTRELGPTDELDGGNVLPGFSVRVNELFKIPKRP